MSREKFEFSKFAEKLGLSVVAVLAAAIAFFLSAVSLMHTTSVDRIDGGEGRDDIVYRIREQLESVIYYNDNLFVNLLMLGIMLLLCFILVQRAKNIRLRWLGLFIFLWTAALGIIWVLSSQSAPSDDSGIVTSASWAFAEDKYEILESWNYFNHYPFQLGYVRFNELLIRFMQAFRHLDNLLPLAVINAVFLGVINLFVLLINSRLFKDSRINLLTTVLLALSSAPIISCSFIYGIYPGMMFALIALYCEIRWLQDDKLLFAVPAIPCIAMAVMIKSNYLIWMIAMILIVLIKMWGRKKYLFDAGFLVLVLVCSLSIQPLVISYYEKESGYDFGDGIPYSSWIAMGLGQCDLAPGWFNIYVTEVNFEESGCDAKAADEKSKQLIKEHLRTFAKNPQYTTDFFYLKTVSQWNDTAYESIWNNVVRGQYKEKGKIAGWVCGDGKKTVKKLMDYFAQMVFFAFCAGCVMMFKRKEFMLTPFPVIFLGGFFYHTISEGKSQYILPYFILMTGFAAFGIVCLCDLLRRRLSAESRLGRLLKAEGIAAAAAAPEAAEAACSAGSAPNTGKQTKNQKKQNGKKGKNRGKS